MNPILEGVKDILDILNGSSWTNEQRLDLVKFWIETRTKQEPELEIKSGPSKWAYPEAPYYNPVADNLQKKLETLVEERIKFIQSSREELVEAFLAKTGFQPDEVEMVQRNFNNGDIGFSYRQKPDCVKPPEIWMVWNGSKIDHCLGTFGSFERCKKYIDGHGIIDSEPLKIGYTP
jgi:hypothetical protein